MTEVTGEEYDQYAKQFAELFIRGDVERYDFDDWVWNAVDCTKYTDDEMDEIVGGIEASLKTRLVITIK